jgi:nuclear cap-binding protein subunit 1
MGNNVITPASFVEALETLLSSAAMTVDDEKGNPAWQARADFYIFCIMASLPWAGLELLEVSNDKHFSFFRVPILIIYV